MKKGILIIIFIALFFGILAVYSQEEPKDIVPVPRSMLSSIPRLLLRFMDLDNDRKISQEEQEKFFAAADQDKDGFITQKELTELMNRRRMEKDGPGMGDNAPNFDLTTLDGKSKIKLSDFRGKDIVLMF